MSDKERYYWCVFCARAIPITYDEDARDAAGNAIDWEQGYIVHDDVPHPLTFDYDEESRPQ